ISTTTSHGCWRCMARGYHPSSPDAAAAIAAGVYSTGMCELLGMECNVPTDITFSFAGLSARGGRRGPHAHGWGLALYEGNVAHVFREPAPACESPLATFVREHPIKTLLAIAHVRRKTR